MRLLNLLPLLLLMLAGLCSLVPAAKLLLLPCDHKGHVNFFRVTAQALQERGHEAVLLTHNRNRALVEDRGIGTMLFSGPRSANSALGDEKLIESTMYTSGLSHLQSLSRVASLSTQSCLDFCYDITSDTATMDELRQHRFDLALVDGVDVCRALYVIAYKLDVPYISLTARHDPWAAGVPAIPSVEGMLPFIMLDPEAGFGRRLGSLVAYTMSYVMMPPWLYRDQQISDMAPERPATTYTALFQASGVILVNNDNTCIDFPRVTAPHYHFIGGIAASDAKPLPSDFELIAGAAKQGLVVVSFGSLVKRSPENLVRKMFVVFGELPELTFIMRYDGQLDDVPPNVHLFSWLPQNDLLGHKNTRLFITHGGNNGQMEGLYHAIPMLVMPFFGDQFYNAYRVEYKRFGKFVNPMSVSVDEFREALREVLDNTEYARNIGRCSAIVRSFPSAHETTDFWVRHILKFGSEHLKPNSLGQPIWRWFMLDVLLLVLVLTTVVGWGLYRCCRCCCCVDGERRRCLGGRGSRKEKKA